MKPTLWGPGLWHLMLSIAWNCREVDFPTLLRVLLHDIPFLLPCALCQQHYVRNHAALVRRHGEPKDPAAAFEWIYHLKDEVNKTTKRKSIPLRDLRERFLLSGGRVDDVLVADLLVVMAIHAEAQGTDAEFVAFCHNLRALLPLPEDSELLRSLGRVSRPVVSHAYRAYKNTRVEHGIRCSGIRHIRQLVA